MIHSCEIAEDESSSLPSSMVSPYSKTLLWSELALVCTCCHVSPCLASVSPLVYELSLP